MPTRTRQAAHWLLGLSIGLSLIGAAVLIGRASTDQGNGSSSQAQRAPADTVPNREAVARPDAGGPSVYRIYGLFLIDNEADLGREGLPRSVLQLKVERYELASEHLKRDTRYPALAWKVIEEGYQGVYGLSDTLKARLNKRAQLTGVVYNMCGYGMYLRREDDSEADCLLPDKPTQVELVDGNRLPLTALPAQ